jgi:formiminotetrahydrofolate cyclodeaminase
MNLTDTLDNYLNELSSNAPTPGGGNVSALCGAISASLGIMVCNLTIGKKKYIEVEEELKQVKEKLEFFKAEFLILGKKDNEAFERVMDAFRLPKETNEEKALRTEAIEKATEGAALIPAEVIRNCKRIVEPLKIVLKKGNTNSVSDAGVAITLISAAAEGALLNVLINCSSLLNRSMAKKLIADTESDYSEVKAASQKLISEVVQNMKNQ